MSVIWTFKKWLVTNHEIYTATDLQEALRSHANVALSIQALCSLLGGPPKALRVQTAQAICNAFRCELNEFFSVEPDPPGEATRLAVASGGPRPLYGCRRGKAEDQEELFPNPALFRKHK
jgi:DNA-binding Xre family transcriptional regulator